MQLSRSKRNDAGTSRTDSFNLNRLLSGGSNRAAGGTRKDSRAPGIYPVAKSQRGVDIARVPSDRLTRSPGSPSSGRSVIPISRYQQPTVIPTDSLRRRPTAEAAVGLPPHPQALPQGRSPRRTPPLIHAIRLLILGVGIGAIAGTLLSIFDPASQSTGEISQMTMQGSIAEQPSDTKPNVLSRLLPDGAMSAPQRSQEMMALKSTLQTLLAQNPHLTAGVSLVELDTGAYVDLNATTPLPAASTVKVPVLVAFLEAVDAGTVRLDEMLTMEQGDVAVGSGEMQYQAVGTQLSALETAEMMITISDNTATNMLIRRLGGVEVLNQRFQNWGLSQTVLRNWLADLEGTNITTSQDLTNLLIRVSQGELLSLRSRDRLMEIMQGTVAESLIPAGVADQQAVIAHKTGTLDNMVGDTGIVDMPNGKRFVVTVLVQRPTDDESAPELIRQICDAAYQYLNQSSGLTSQ